MPRPRKRAVESVSGIPSEYDSGVLGQFTTAGDFEDGGTYMIERAHIESTTNPEDREKRNPKAVVKFTQQAKATILNETSRKAFGNAWGRDMRKWVNQRCKVRIALQNVRGNMTNVAYFSPI